MKIIAVKIAQGYALAVVAGTDRLDMKLVRWATGDGHTRLATEDELEGRKRVLCLLIKGAQCSSHGSVHAGTETRAGQKLSVGLIRRSRPH